MSKSCKSRRLAVVRCLLLGFLAAALLAMPASDAKAANADSSTPLVVQVVSEKAYIRTDVSLTSPVIAHVRKNAILDVYAFEPYLGWYLVSFKLPKGVRKGWIRRTDVVPYSSLNKHITP